MRLSILEDLAGLFYPKVCAGCDAHLMVFEQNLCLQCLHGLPKTYYWDYEVTPIEELFWGRLEVSSACSYLHFNKDGVIQKLMHRFKYDGKRNIGEGLGRLFAHQLKEKKWFTDATLIVPIPLHRTKQIRRGYNQSAFIANGMAEVFDIPAKNNALKRVLANESQTRKSRYQRTENVENVFKSVRTNVFRGENVLLVDDVVTTGATLEAAGREILINGAAKLYIATLACA